MTLQDVADRLNRGEVVMLTLLEFSRIMAEHGSEHLGPFVWWLKIREGNVTLMRRERDPG